MNKGIVILLLLVIMLGCNFFRSPGKDRCQKILSREKMTEVLTDIYLMDAFLLERQISHPNVRDSAVQYYQVVFDKHEISFEIFNEALSCYLLDYEDIDQIHETILNTISLKLSEIQTDPQSPRYAPGQPPADEIHPEGEPSLPDTVSAADPSPE